MSWVVRHEERQEAGVTRSGAVTDFAPTLNALSAYTPERLSKNALTFPVSEPLNNSVYDSRFDASWELDAFGSKKRRTLEQWSTVGWIPATRTNLAFTNTLNGSLQFYRVVVL